MSSQRFIVVLLTSAAAIPQAASPAPAGLWLDVPYIHQEKDGCGSAALAMLLQYWNSKQGNVPPERSDPQAIQEQLYSHAAHGVYASAMEAYLRESGFDVFAFRGEWKDLPHHISAGRPLLVSLRASRGAALHYAVVAGVEPEQPGDSGVVLLNDSARGKLFRMSRVDFEKEWRGAENWMLLAVPKRRE